jgi:hypothetical protein
MEELRSYHQLAKSKSLAEFVVQSNPLFLIKRPLHHGVSRPVPAVISFETKHAELDVDPFAAEWRITPVKKREGNPYPDRYSIGRAPNCDVVIRMPSVSKVHAHILITGPSSYCLRDNEASNSTYVNGCKLEARARVPLHVGDEVVLGALRVEFIDAGRLYLILHTEF